MYWRKNKKPKRPSKSICQKLHAAKRANQRYGLIISDNINKNIVNIIRNGEAKLIEKQSLRIRIYKVKIKNHRDEIIECKVVYDKKRGTIVTFLPDDENYVSAY